SNSSPVQLTYSRVEGVDRDPDPPDPPLFIMHGLFGNKKNWRTIALTMNEKTGREIVTIDARNHGKSEHHDRMNYTLQALDARQLMYELEIPKAVLVGHSMGGKVGMTFALTYPEMVDKLIVVDVSPSRSVSEDDIQRYLNTKLQMDLGKVRSKQDAEKMLEGAVKVCIVHLVPMLRQFFLTNLVATSTGFQWRVNLEAIDRNLEEIMTFPEEFPYPTFEGDVLFIGGAKSNYIQRSDYARIYKLFPRAEITYIPDCGHWVHVDKPNELMDIILEFLSRDT
ncbi:predicted protein, partial [Nematostella vectensis]